MKQTQNAIRLIFFSFGLTLSSWAPLIPYTKNKLELNEAELGMVLLILGIGALIMMPITGLLINRIGSKAITLISAIGIVLTLPMLALPSSIVLLSLILFIFGLTTGAMNVAMNAQAVDIEKASNASIMSGIHSFFSIGGLCGSSFICLLLEQGYKPFYCMLAIAALIALIFMCNWHKLLQSKTVSLKTNTSSPSRYSTPVIILGLLCFIAFMAEGAMLDWSAEYLHTNLNYEISLAGMGYAAFSIAMATGRFFGDSIVKKWGSLTVFQAGCLLSSCGFILIITMPYAEMIGFAFIGFGAANIVPILFTGTGRISHVSSDHALSIVTTFGYMGLLLGPVFIGFIAQKSGLKIAFLFIAFLLVTIGFFGKNKLPKSVAQVT